jgi:hypothetical protein
MIFNYLYYRTYALYKNKWNEVDPKLYAAGIVSLMQEFNLGAILFLILQYFDITIERLYVYLFYIVLFALNMIWYSKFRIYKYLESKWKDDIKSRKIFKGILVIVYIVLSTLIFFKTAIYIGKIS